MSAPHVIVGLGNPGQQYQNTRHNIGFMCVSSFARAYQIEGKSDTKHKAIVGQGRVEGHKVFVVQPMTYMNLSGDAVLPLVQYYDVPLENCIIVFDDVAIPFGRFRFRPQGSSGSQKGMKSVIQRLGSDSIPRLRVGIGQPPPQWNIKDYVLAKFTPEEQAVLPKLEDMCVQALTHWLCQGTESAMNHFNGVNLMPEQQVEEQAD